MKQRLLELINDIDKIEKLFHPSSPAPRGVVMVETEIIYDVQDFRLWIQEVKLELQAIFDATHDKFIWETINDVSATFNGWRDRRDFDKIKGDLYAIQKNIDKYYPQTAVVVAKETEVAMQKKAKIFISHSSKDKQYVEELVSLLDDMGLNDDQIFCSSIPGYDIPLRKTIFDYLLELFNEYNLHVIFVHSQNYYQSPVSLNEMGAAWVLKNTYTSFLLPGFDFSEMKGVVNNSSIAIKLDNSQDEIKDKLNQLYDQLVSEFGIKKKASIIWEKKRDAFINGISNITPQSINVSEKRELCEEALEILFEASRNKDAIIIITSDLSSGKIIQYGSKSHSQAEGQQEFSKLEAAIDELLKLEMIKPTGSKGEIFTITRKGFELLESIPKQA